MNIFLIIAMIITNIVSVVIVYQILKKQPKKEILIFIAAGVAIIYFIISIIYWLSGFGIDNNIHNKAKDFIVFMFVPINVILFMPYLAVQYKKLRQNKKIEKFDIENLSKKVTIAIIVFILISIGEFFYFKNIQQNIESFGLIVEKRTTTNNNTIDNNTNTIETNEIENAITNEITNEIKNEVANDVVNNSSNVISNEVVNNVNEV